MTSLLFLSFSTLLYFPPPFFPFSPLETGYTNTRTRYSRRTFQSLSILRLLRINIIQTLVAGNYWLRTFKSTTRQCYVSFTLTELSYYFSFFILFSFFSFHFFFSLFPPTLSPPFFCPFFSGYFTIGRINIDIWKRKKKVVGLIKTNERLIARVIFEVRRESVDQDYKATATAAALTEIHL